MPTTTPYWDHQDDRFAIGLLASLYGGLALAVALALLCPTVAQAEEPPV